MSSWEPVVLLFVRALALAAWLPLGSGFAALLSRSLSAAVLTLLGALSGAAPQSEFSGAACAAELFVGTLLALPCALTVEAAALFAELIEAGRGANMAVFYDPLSGAHGSPFAALARAGTGALLLTAGLAESLVAVFVSAAKTLPPGTPDLAQLLNERSLQLMEMTSFYLSGVTWFYLPCAVVFLMIDSCLGAAAKLSPRVALSQEAFQLKTYATIAILLELNAAGATAALVDCGRPLMHLAGLR